jgi:hypothetical protein
MPTEVEQLRFLKAQIVLTDEQDPGVYSIGAVARMLDIPASTLRAWEERYSLITRWCTVLRSPTRGLSLATCCQSPGRRRIPI